MMLADARRGDCLAWRAQVRSGLTEAVAKDQVVRLHFTDVGKLPPPVLQFISVTFGYTPDCVLYSNVNAHFRVHGTHLESTSYLPNRKNLVESQHNKRGWNSRFVCFLRHVLQHLHLPSCPGEAERDDSRACLKHSWAQQHPVMRDVI